MKTLHSEIIEKFLARLEKAEHVDSLKREQLQKLLKETKKPKADELIKIFSQEGSQ